ncbi:hypothetical protein [Streptomyces sp. NPDC059894]|uniref:hypothetical protein n=1 Tax=unclassified Streptomyces TaxID=2593676 RepID=UPI00364E2E3F
MPRPTVAQLTYGSCTVIFSALAMLALSQTSSGSLIAVISITAVALGVLVAMTVPVPRRGPVVVARSTATADEPVRASVVPAASVVPVVPVASVVPVVPAASAPEPVREPSAS